MRQKIYHFLVNRVPGISYRYHQQHDSAAGMAKIFSWIYLLWLNFCYYVLSCRFLGRRPDMEYYESKRLPAKASESALHIREHPGLSVEAFVDRLKDWDVVSFDIFDTLILRPFSQPTDLFFFMDGPLGILDFHRIRIKMEAAARPIHCKEFGNYEVTLEEIWRLIEKEVGVSAAAGVELEQKLELEFCYANPFMLEVYRRLQALGKRMVITSDMYLPSEFLEKLLENCGYTGFERLYVSCESGKSKTVGDLFDHVRGQLGENLTFVHVGDNEHSDIGQAKRHGFAAVFYPNVNKKAPDYRPYDMSAMVGGAYRGLVDSYLYNGSRQYGIEYEYGFIYGGLFVVGYCAFIHEYCKQNQVDKLLFLARDGDTLKKVYDFLYPGENTAYVYWSRIAATKLMADYDRYDFFRRFILHKVGRGQTFEQILLDMELKPLAEGLKRDGAGLDPNTVLTASNAEQLKAYLAENWADVLNCYRDESLAAEAYFTDELRCCKNAAAVDIGWAGSGAAALSYLVERVWNIPCQVTGVIAGTNTMYNAEPDASEGFLQSGRLTAYLYSQSHNRDLLKKHDLNRDYNVYWELLLSSPTPQFLGYMYDAGGRVIPRFGKYDHNLEGIKDIQQGILDFAAEYQRHFGRHEEMFRISGRDAYAPMLAASGNQEQYLRNIAAKFQLDVSVSSSSGAGEDQVDRKTV